jgi:ACS family allantoate permease-like MFS transporter
MRLYSMSASCVPSIVGAALLHTLPADNKWGRVIALWATFTFSVTLAMSFAVIGGNIAGTAKKITVTFILFLGYCAGSIAAPQFFKASEESEGYPTGIKTMLSCICLLFVLPLILRGLYMWENMRREKAAVDGEVETSTDPSRDKTDKELNGFRYMM